MFAAVKLWAPQVCAPQPRRAGVGRAFFATHVAWAAATLAFATPCPCRADEQQAFELRKNRFDAGRYDEAHDGLAVLLDPKGFPCAQIAEATAPCRLTDTDLVERARAMDAASLLALKRQGEADLQIETLLRANPQYAPSPAQYPQEVIDRFTIVRGRIQGELDALAQRRKQDELETRLAKEKAREAEEKYLAELRRMASEERVVHTGSRWVAMVPFGIGHFQNGTNGRAWAFLVGESLAGATSLVAVVAFNKIASTNVANPVRATYTTLNNQANAATVVNHAAFGAWAAGTVADVVWAQIAFVPERVTVRPRPLPERPTLTPIAFPIPNGMAWGLSGRF
jgi:hypothetical protein